jgi:hypothetical protein
MESKKLGRSPEIECKTRDRINAITKIYGFKRFSETVNFFAEVFDLIFKGREFESKEEMISFVLDLMKDKTEIVTENIELKSKIEKIQKTIDE